MVSTNTIRSAFFACTALIFLGLGATAQADGSRYYSCAAYQVRTAGSVAGATALLLEDRLAAYAVDDFAIRLGLTTTCFGECQCETYERDGRLRFDNDYGVNTGFCPDGYSWTHGGRGGCNRDTCEAPLRLNSETGECSPPEETYTCPTGETVSDIANCPVRRTEENCPTTRIGNPIDFRDGTKHESKIDYEGGGAFPLTVSRHYSSAGQRSSGRWTFDFSGGGTRRLEFPPGESAMVWVRDPDGTVLAFTSTDGIEYTGGSDVVARLEATAKGWTFTDQTGRVEEYGHSGRVARVIRRNGLSHRYRYSNSQLTVTDDYGRKLVVDRTDGRITAVTLPDGSKIEYAYDANARLREVTYADGSRIAYLYENAADSSLLTGIVDERGVRYATFDYDSDGRAVLSEHVAGSDRHAIVYDGDKRIVTNPLGKMTEHVLVDVNGVPKLKTSDRLQSTHCGAASSDYEYDIAGHVERESDWRGNVTTYARNSRGLVTRTTRALGTDVERSITTQWHTLFPVPEVVNEPHRITTYTYAPYDDSNPASKTVRDRATGETRTWSYAYDDHGQLVSIDGPRTDVADVTTYAYHSCATGGRCGQLASVTDAMGHVVTYESYDAHGLPTRIVDANGQSTELTYDARQRVTTMTTAGATTSVSYDASGNVEQLTLPDDTFFRHEYDESGRLVASLDAQGNRIDWILDAAGNRIEQMTSDPSGTLRHRLAMAFDELDRLRSTIRAHGGAVIYEHDANGNVTRVTDELGRSGSYTYDALDRLVRHVDTDAGETSYTYDDQDNLISVTDPEGSVTRYAYNGFGDRLSVVSLASGTTRFTVDEVGNPITRTDARGIVTTYTYDALDRLVRVEHDEEEAIAYTHDQGPNALGRLSRVTDASGSTDYEYDERGNFTRVRQRVGDAEFEIRYRYNAADRLIGMTYPSGRTLEHTLDASGRISATVAIDPQGVLETLATDIGRLPFGPLTTLRLGNGLERKRTYDLDYRPITLTDGAGAATVFSRGYAWSDVDTLAAITDTEMPAASQLFAHDRMDRLTFATGIYGEREYAYDAIGNRIATTHAAEDGTVERSELYTYTPENRRLTTITGSGATSLTHDAAGNTLHDGLRTFAYDARGRLASVERGGSITTYSYDAFGRRVQKRLANGEITRFVFDLEGHLIAEASEDGSVTVEYAWLDGGPLAMWRNDGLDGTGDVDTGSDGGSGDPAVTMLRLEAEDYDEGGPGVGYFDTSAGNSGGAHRGDDVDIQATADTGGGYNVGWTADGEWLAWTVDVPSTARFDVTLRYAVRSASGAQRAVLSVDGVVLGETALADTGGWQAWSEATIMGARLEGGTRTLRLTLYGGFTNLNWLEIGASAEEGGKDTPPDATAPVIVLNGESPLVVAYGTPFVDPGATATDEVDGLLEVVASGSVDSGIAGDYAIEYVARDAAGNTARLTREVRVLEAATDGEGHSGTKLAVLSVEAEDYDAGGPGVGYDDTTVGNAGGTHRGDDVDIEITRDVGGGFNVGWTADGEWLAYTVEIPVSGRYDLTARYATRAAEGEPSNGRGLVVAIDGVRRGALALVGTGGWQSWSEATLEDISLSSGEHTLRVSILGGALNLNRFVLAEREPVATTVRIEAEDYDGGVGVGYVDTSAGNSGGRYRTDDVDIELTRDVDGGFNVGWITDGEWLAWTAEVEASGDYDVVLRYAVNTGSGVHGAQRARLKRADDLVLGETILEGTGAWQTWSEATIERVSLARGQHRIRLELFGGKTNLNWIELRPVVANEAFIQGGR